MSGKTTLAMKMSKALQRKNVKTIVLDPFLDPEWYADFITSDQDEFLNVVWDVGRQCAIFVDESGDAIGKYNNVMNELATRGRHWGHICHFICQRPKQLSTTIRTQCSNLAIFKQSLADTKDLANEFVDNEINNAHTLEKGEFIYVRDGHKTVKLNAFNL